MTKMARVAMLTTMLRPPEQPYPHPRHEQEHYYASIVNGRDADLNNEADYYQSEIGGKCSTPLSCH